MNADILQLDVAVMADENAADGLATDVQIAQCGAGTVVKSHSRAVKASEMEAIHDTGGV